MTDNAPQRARQLFSTGGFYWAESVLLAVAESQGIQSDLLPKIATGFCSGVARTAGQCGALTGAVMGLGLLTGRDEPGAPVDQNYKRVQALVKEFEEKYGSINCQVLTGVHLGTAEGQAQFQEKNQIKNCLNYAEGATRMVLDLAGSQDKT